MPETAVRRRPGGRSARVRESVLDATLAVLAEGGVDKLTVADIAARAGVHETSIRRRWCTKENLICDAMLNYSEQNLPIPDTGSLREDLVAFASELAAYDTTPLGKALLHAMATAGDDPSLAEARSAFWRTRRELASAMIERAVARGELPDTVDSGLALDALLAPLHFRTLLTAEPLDDDLPRKLADLVLDGIREGGRVGAQQRSAARSE
jgi:AcrR family transcriptional regulator